MQVDLMRLYDTSKNFIRVIADPIDTSIEYDIKLDGKILTFKVVDSELIFNEQYIRFYGQEWVIKATRRDGQFIEVTAKHNIEELVGNAFNFVKVTSLNLNGILTVIFNAANANFPSFDWTYALSADLLTRPTILGKRRSMDVENIKFIEVIEEVLRMWFLEVEFNTLTKQVIFHYKRGTNKGVYFSSQLNLRKIDLESDTYDYVTRLIPVGKDGLRISSVNGGKDYVENYTYSNKVLVAFWVDNRYTDATTLRDDAILKLEELAIPMIVYSCDIVDLSSQNPMLSYDIGDTVTTINEQLGMKDVQRIMKMVVYPYDPEKNTAELASRKPKFEDLQNEMIDAREKVNGEISAIVSDVGSLAGRVSEAESNITQTETQIELGVKSSSNTRDSVVPYNQFEWEQGAIDGWSGANIPSTEYIRTIGFHSVKPSTQYALECSDTLDSISTIVFWYNGTTFLSFDTFNPNGKIVTSPATATNCRLRMRKSDATTFNLSEMPNHWARVSPNATLKEMSSQLTIQANEIATKVTATYVDNKIAEINKANPNRVSNLPANYDQGDIVSGVNSNSNLHIRTRLFYPIASGFVTYQIADVYEAKIILYDSSYAYIREEPYSNKRTFNLTNSGFFKVVVRSKALNTILPAEIETSNLKVANESSATAWNLYFGDLTLEQQKDLYTFKILSRAGLTFDGTSSTLQLDALVLLNNVDVTDLMTSQQFAWTRVSKNPTLDSQFNALGITGKTLTITSTYLDRSATYMCLFTISESAYLVTKFGNRILTKANNHYLLAITSGGE